MGLKVPKRSILTRCMKGPIKILARARDLYFQNMSSSGAHVFYGSAMSCPTPQLGSLPGSMSRTSSNSGHSKSSGGYSRGPSPMSRKGLAEPVPRRQSVPIGRIDENKFYEYDGPKVVRPRSRSCAAARRNKAANANGGLVMDLKYTRI